VLGTLLGFSIDGKPLIDFAGNPSVGVVAAESCADIDDRDCGAQVAVAFEGGDRLRPIVLGVLRSRKSQGKGRALNPGENEPAVVELDGKTVTLAAADTLTLRCGTASITLSRDGTLIIRGAYLQSRSEGVNRIQGGSVQIN
jgi:hypothetical protein